LRNDSREKNEINETFGSRKLNEKQRKNAKKLIDIVNIGHLYCKNQEKPHTFPLFFKVKCNQDKTAQFSHISITASGRKSNMRRRGE